MPSAIASRVPRTLPIAGLRWPGLPVIVAVVALLHLVLNVAVVFPYVYQINPLDGMYFILTGRLLANGISEGHAFFPEFHNNPLVVVAYALIYAPLRQQIYWLVVVEWIARLFSFTLLWLSAYLVARRIRHLAHPLLLVGLLFLAPVIPSLVGANLSDALFATFCGLALAQLIGYQQTGRVRHLAIASLLLGLAAHTRNDAFALFLTFLFLVVVSVRFGPTPPGRHLAAWLRPLAAAFLPFVAVVGSYLVVQGILTGQYVPATMGRAYAHFELAEGAVYDSRPEAIEAGVLEARRLYGTPEENNYSVLNAIRHNPSAFTRRVLHVLSTAPATTANAYGGAFGVVLFGCALAGLVGLVRSRRYLLVGTLLFWPAFLSVYPAFQWNARYVLLPAFAVVVLATIGAAACWEHRFDYRAGYAYAAALILAVAAGVLLQQVSIAAAGILAGAGMLAIWALARKQGATNHLSALGVLVLLGGALLLRGPYPPLQLPRLGTTGEEQITRYLVEHVPRGTTVGAYAPTVVAMAKMTWAPIPFELPPDATEADLNAWLEKHQVQAIYLDYLLKWLNPAVYDLVERHIGDRFVEVFAVDDTSPERLRTNAALAESFGVEISPRHRIVVVREPGGIADRSQPPS